MYRCEFFSRSGLVCVCVRRFKLKNLPMHPLEFVETRAKAPLSHIAKSFFDAAEFQPNSIRIEFFFFFSGFTLGKMALGFYVGSFNRIAKHFDEQTE